MAGTKTSGNRSTSRGRPLPKRYTLSRQSAERLRDLTRARLGRHDVSQEEMLLTLEAMLQPPAE